MVDRLRRSHRNHATLTPTATPPRARRPVDVTIRRAFPDDAAALARLAALDGVSPVIGDALIAEVAGEAWAVLTVDGEQLAADPFRPTAHVVALLRTRAAQLRAGTSRSGLPARRLVLLLGGR